MPFSNKMIEKAQSMKRNLVLPEGHDKRVLTAASILQKKNVVSHLALIGKKDVINQQLKELSITLDDTKTEIIDSETDMRLEEFAHIYHQKRKHKGTDEKIAFDTMKDPLYFAAMLVEQHTYHAMIAGATHPTANVLRSALHIVGVASGLKKISSAFVIEHGTKQLGEQGCLIFSDCAIIPKPSAEDIVHITLAASKTCRTYLEAEPRIALLSFSTLGSAQHEEVEKVQLAVSLLRKEAPTLQLDGELQMDAALRPEVARMKSPHSQIAGKANTIIFPDLASANIAYKTTQIFGKAVAYGPIIQGLAAPVSDLSRGCNAEEIIISSAMTLIQERE